MSDLLHSIAVLGPTILWFVFLYWVIESAKGDKVLHKVGTSFKIIIIGTIAALFLGWGAWELADWVTEGSRRQAQDSATVEEFETLGSRIPTFGSSTSTYVDGQEVTIDADAAPAQVQDGDQAIEVVPPVVPTKAPLPQRTFDPKSPPVNYWAAWFDSSNYDQVAQKDKGLISTELFPAGMVCDLTNVGNTAFVYVENETWELQNCRVPGKADWGTATIPVNGVTASALNGKSGKVQTIRGTNKEWPEGTFRLVKPTTSGSSSSGQPEHEYGGISGIAPKRFSLQLELIANQACRAGTVDSSPSLADLTAGTLVQGDPAVLANTTTGARIEVFVPSVGTCWIRMDGNYVVQK